MSTQKVKYLDKRLLSDINEQSKRIGYNRTIPTSIIKSLPDDKYFVVLPLMVHEHMAGNAVDPHMRCQIYAGDLHPWLILDMVMSVYDFIPDYEVQEKEEGEKVAT